MTPSDQADDPASRARAAVRAAHPDVLEPGAVPLAHHPAGGPLFLVTFRTAAGETREHYVHLDPGGGPVLYRHADELVRNLVARPARDTLARLVRDFASLGGFAGLIALLVATGVCIAYVRAPDVKIPDLLAHLLTSFVSFYLGHRLNRVG